MAGEGIWALSRAKRRNIFIKTVKFNVDTVVVASKLGYRAVVVSVAVVMILMSQFNKEVKAFFYVMAGMCKL